MKKMRMAAGVLAVLLACRAVPFGNAEAAGVEMRNLEILETGQKIQSRKSVSKPGYETVCSAEQKIPLPARALGWMARERGFWFR